MQGRAANRNRVETGATGSPKAMIFIASAATFLAFLDITVVNVAFPSLAQDFHGASVSTLSWVVTLYAVLFAAVLAPSGRLADAFGRREVFLAGVVTFTLASLASAIAPSVGFLIAARGLQGIAAALMLPAALGVVLAVVPKDKRTGAIGIWAAAGALAAGIGPSVGAALVEAFDWRAVFVLNLPVGAVLIAVGARSIPRLAGHDRRLPDLAGTALLTVALALVVLAITKSADWGWSDGTTVITLSAGLAGLVLSVARATRHPSPAIETRLWQSGIFVAANFSALLLGAVMFVFLWLGVLFLTQVWHYSILEAGLAVTPPAVTTAIGAIVASKLTNRFGYRAFAVAGAIGVAAISFWLSQSLTSEPDFLGIWLPAGSISGIALGAAVTAVSGAAAESLDSEELAAGMALNMTARQIGGAVGVAVVAATLESGQGSLGAYLDSYMVGAVAGVLLVIPALFLQPTGALRLVRSPAATLDEIAHETPTQGANK